MVINTNYTEMHGQRNIKFLLESVFFHQWVQESEKEDLKMQLRYIYIYILTNNILIEDWFPSMLELRFQILLPQ
jgi:hypothetical protein